MLGSLLFKLRLSVHLLNVKTQLYLIKTGHAKTQTADRADQGKNMALPSLLLRANRKQANLNVI